MAVVFGYAEDWRTLGMITIQSSTNTTNDGQCVCAT